MDWAMIDIVFLELRWQPLGCVRNTPTGVLGFGCAGVIREPVTGWQDDGIVGLLLGLVMGTSGVLLKPTSGILAFTAKTLGGLGAGIRQWGDDMVRAPRTRIRSPRQFAALTGDPTGHGGVPAASAYHMGAALY